MNLDPRIGVLNNGRYYAFVDGHGLPEFVGTLEEVEVKLGIRAATPEPAAPTVATEPSTSRERTWDVRLSFQYPAWDEVGGVWYRGIVASSKSAANAMARKMAAGDGHLYELLHPMRCKGWSFTGRMNPRLGQFLTGY